MRWFLLALGASLCFAVSQIFVKKGFKNIPPLWNNIINNLLTFFFWMPPVLLFSGFKIMIPSPLIFSAIFIASSFYQSFYYVISKGQISLTGTVVAGCPAITIILSYLFLGERLTSFQYLGIALLLMGGIIVALPENKSLNEGKDRSWLLWGLSGAFLIGTGDFLTKFSINQIGSYSHIFFLSLIFNLISILNYTIDKNNRPIPKFFSKSFLNTFIGIAIHLLGALIFLLAFDYGKVSLITPVASIYPAFVVLLAMRFLKESITLKQGMGIFVILIGLILMGYGK